MSNFNKKPTNQRRYETSSSHYQSANRYSETAPKPSSSYENKPPVTTGNNTPKPPQSIESSLAQLTQQFNLLLLLFVALFLFNMFMYWKMRTIEAKAGSATTAAPTQPGAPAQVQVTEDQVKGLFAEGNITFGDKNSKLLFVEFSDPSCPFCHIAAGKNPELNAQVGEQFKMVADGGAYVPPVEEMKKLVDEGKAAFSWIYQNGHGNGELSTQALYCAHEKGLFWQAHDKLMTNAGYTLINDVVKNDKAKAPELAQFLADVIDPTFMTECLSSAKYADRIAKDQQTAASVGVSGTPGFFVNTKNFAGAYSFKDMQADVDAALQ